MKRRLGCVASQSLLALCLLLSAPLAAAEGGAADSLPALQQSLLDQAFNALAPQRPDRPDLYVVGFAGDGHEDVFRNEVAYLKLLFEQRFDARNRIVTLINHADSLGDAPAPLATLDNLRTALARIGRLMDPEHDLLLLFITSHGTADHRIWLQLYPVVEASIDPEQLRTALDQAGIRNRIVVVSACYSGGFVQALRDPDTLIVTASAEDRPSFGCGADATATYFGRAWLVEGLNRTGDFIAAYDLATRNIADRELRDGYPPSLPQIDIGADIAQRLHVWGSSITPGPPVPYPHRE
ncbi:MAG: C13 family peptidase [Gammaproteobacteria bacterium]|nr:C13 family peptidase [Gammaproteobacteria bacterium]